MVIEIKCVRPEASERQIGNLFMMRRATVIGIGEILWDVFPDGRAWAERRPISRAVLLSSPETESTCTRLAPSVPRIWVGEPLKRFICTVCRQVASQSLMVAPDKSWLTLMPQAERVTSLLPAPRGIMSRGPMDWSS